MNDLHHRIRQQYASVRGNRFYQTVMGDGGFDTHYGIYSGPSTVSMQEATLAATTRLFALAQARRPDSQFCAVLDLGSGRGGPSHFLATQCDAVTCVDLCREHHAENVLRARELGVASNLATWLGSFEVLPKSWERGFDLTWSQETFCHAENIDDVLAEAYRVTGTGGVIAFTDIMIATDHSGADAKPFSDVNAVIRMTTPDAYVQSLARCGFNDVQHEDWSHELATNFQRMLDQIRAHREILLRQGVDEDYLRSFEASLKERLSWARGSVLRWGAFTAVRT